MQHYSHSLTIDALTSPITDTSDQTVSLVVPKFVKGVWDYLAFFSKKLQLPERKYIYRSFSKNSAK